MHVHAASFVVIAEERFTVTLVNKFEDLILSAIIIYVIDVRIKYVSRGIYTYFNK